MMDETQLLQAMKVAQSNPDLAAKILAQTGMSPEQLMAGAQTEGSLIPTGETMTNNTLGSEIEPMTAVQMGQGQSPVDLSSLFGMIGKGVGTGSSDVKPIFPSGMAKAPEPMKITGGAAPASLDALIKLITAQKTNAAPVVPSLGQLMGR